MRAPTPKKIITTSFMYLSGRKPRRSAPGTAPGDVLPQPDAQPPVLSVVSYGPEVAVHTIEHKVIATIDDLPAFPAGHMIRWINVTGLGDPDVLQAIGTRFRIHPLILEDISSTWQRPKVEVYDDCMFMVTRIPLNNGNRVARERMDVLPAHTLLTTQQVAMCLGKDFLITFLEVEDEAFDTIRKRLSNPSARLRSKGADYLAYAILDTAIDMYFPLLEDYGEEVENLESSVIQNAAMGQIGDIHALKRDLFTARRVIWPQRDMLNTIIRDEHPLIAQDTRLFFRDCYDHTIQLLDIIETSREIATGLVDILLSSQSNKMNEVMQVLTIIATIFIPLSWISGVYGMNFNPDHPWNMPELDWPYGYVMALGLMAVIAGGMLIYFWRKGWIGRSVR